MDAPNLAERALLLIPHDATLEVIALGTHGWALVARTLAVEWLRAECRFRHEAELLRDALAAARGGRGL